MNHKWQTRMFGLIVFGFTVASVAQNNATLSVGSPGASTRQQSAATNKIRLDQLPLRVQQSVRKHGYENQVAEATKSNLNGRIVYNVTFDNHGKRQQYTFDQNGNVLAEPGRPIQEAAGAEAPNHSESPASDEQHDHHILQHPK